MGCDASWQTAVNRVYSELLEQVCDRQMMEK